MTVYSLVCEHPEFALEEAQTRHTFGTITSPLLRFDTKEDAAIICPRRAGDVPTGWYYSFTLNLASVRGSTVVKVLCYKSEVCLFDPGW